MNNQIDIEAAEAQAAENAYKEIWDALMVLINMGSRERLINFGFETVMLSLSNFGDYQRFLIEIKAYKEKQGILEKEHMKILKCFLNTYGEETLQAAIKRIQEDKG